jgi:hypothetical protein
MKVSLAVSIGVMALFSSACTNAGDNEKELDCQGNRCCTLDKCRVDDSGMNAYCATEPQPKLGLEPCCQGSTAAIAVYACSPAGDRCIIFNEACYPHGWMERSWADRLDSGGE